MARKHYWQFLVTDEGVPIENATITVYRSGSEDAVWVYTDELSSNGSADPSGQVTSSLKGYFEFWVADQEDASNGYNISQKFKIAWSATGVSSGYIDYVDVFSTFVRPVDINATDDLMNKVVSNAMVNGWESHSSAVFPQDEVHGLASIQIGLTDITSNKIMTNYFGTVWDTHARTMFDGSFDSIFPPGLPVTVHGIMEATENVTGYWGNSGDFTLNRLVSDDLIFQWDSHVNDDSLDDHSQYSLVNGTRDYTDAIGYINDTIVGLAGPNDFVTKSFVTGADYTLKFNEANMTFDGAGQYHIDITHNLDTLSPVIALWRTLSPKMVMGLEYEIINNNSVRIFTMSGEEYYVTIMKGVNAVVDIT